MTSPSPSFGVRGSESAARQKKAEQVRAALEEWVAGPRHAVLSDEQLRDFAARLAMIPGTPDQDQAPAPAPTPAPPTPTPASTLDGAVDVVHSSTVGWPTMVRDAVVVGVAAAVVAFALASTSTQSQ